MLTSHPRSPRSRRKPSTTGSDTKPVPSGTNLSVGGAIQGTRASSGLLPRRRIHIMSRISTGKSRASTLQSRNNSDHNNDILEYEWPDLPPIAQIKDAVTRNRICTGMAYILPVDKGKNSVENVFRTDLRYMFREPYRNSLITYNDARVKASTQHHFIPNSPSVKYLQSPDDYTKYTLNSDSEKVRRHYSHSAPPKGITGKNTTPHSEELKTRSTLTIPIKTKLPPEALRMKEEAEKILQSVEENAEAEYDASKEAQTLHTSSQFGNINTSPGKKDNTKRVQFLKGLVTHSSDRKQANIYVDHSSGTDRANKYIVNRKAGRFTSYEDLKDTQLPKKPPMPNTLRSPYLTAEKNADIWEWLTKEEVVTEFNHFMNVCS